MMHVTGLHRRLLAKRLLVSITSKQKCYRLSWTARTCKNESVLSPSGRFMKLLGYSTKLLPLK